MMGHRRYLGVVLAALLMTGGISAWLAGCSVQIQPDAISFTILGKVLTLTFADIGPITTEADQVAKVPTAVRLFDETPPQTPPTGQMTLPSTSVGVAHRLTAKSIIRSQTLPPSGSATIRFNIAAGQSAALCDSATLLAEFEMSLTMGIPAILDEVYDLSPQAIAVMMANDVTICIEITANFDGEITIGEYYFAFGGGDAGTQPPDSPVGPSILPGGLTQVPIDSRNGRAVVAPINRTISGVSYGVVGVLEVQTAAVTNPPAEPSTITVVPAELGLLTVDTLYIGTHSAFVPDMSGGVTLATLTVSYSDGGSPTTLDFVTGSTTAEWSYDRPEHITEIGGVQHAKAPELYGFETTVDSASTYTGYSYSATLPVDSSRTIASLALTTTDPATYAGSRLVTGDMAAWAEQAITAITLAGQGLVIPTEEACCFVDGSCADLDPDDCSLFGGSSQGDGSRCVNTDCEIDTEPVDESEACCIPPNYRYEFGSSPTYIEGCEDIGPTTFPTRADCEFFGGVPQGLGTTCASVTCDGHFSACCYPNESGCIEREYDYCVDGGGDPQFTGVHCNDYPCDYACCFSSGYCEDLDRTTCTNNGGTYDTDGFVCTQVDCDGACCKPDGNCERLTADACDDLLGEFMGLDVDCADVTCDAVGGCCFNDSLTCFDMDAAQCTADGGDVQTNCGPDQCIFACCLTDGTCETLKTVDECNAVGGTVNARGTDCHEVTCAPAPLTWILASTVANSSSDPVEYIGTDRYEGSITTYTITETSISVHDRSVDHGFEWYDVNLHAAFDSPPAQLIPGETFDVSVNLSHSGTVVDFPPGVRAQYRGDGIDVTPDATFWYFPWSDGFTGVSSMTWTFTVPTAGAGGEISISGGWWNCSVCNITWTYRAE